MDSAALMMGRRARMHVFIHTCINVREHYISRALILRSDQFPSMRGFLLIARIACARATVNRIPKKFYFTHRAYARAPVPAGCRMSLFGGKVLTSEWLNYFSST